MRNLYTYSKLYSGKEPIFHEGDIFRIIVPLDENYSYDKGIDNSDPKVDPKQKTTIENEMSILKLIETYPQITRKLLVEMTGITDSTVKRILVHLQKKKQIKRVGSKRSGKWIVL